MYRLISVRSGGQKCAEGIENAKHTSSSVDRVSNQISCTLQTGFGVVRAVYTTKMRPDVLTKLAVTKGRGRR